MRINKIFEFIGKTTKNISKQNIIDGYQGVTAEECSEILGYERSNCSRELNRLNDDQKLIKITGRPVHYFPKKRMEELLDAEINEVVTNSLLSLFDDQLILDEPRLSFETVIGRHGSLKNSISKAKAAMIYPPLGLHTLLVGGTGVGKTMFAEYMYMYAKQSGVLNDNSNFVIFNCAEYADNPQLLLSHLFGYTKGAFSGATEDSEGLIAAADNGILFLDEIHRLSPEGQEMLFLLIDKGFYRKLGDGNETRQANVLIIGATTENVQSSLLGTFTRRIPMTISIPNLSERSVEERYQLIKMFFYAEARKTKRDIRIRKSCIKALLGYRCNNNVGQLKSDIQLICAKAYLNSMVEDTKSINVEKNLLPSYVLKGMIDAMSNQEIEEIVFRIKDNHLLFEKNAKVEQSQLFEKVTYTTNVYQEIRKKWEIESENVVNDQEVISHIEEYITSLFQHSANELLDNQELYKLVTPEMYNDVEIGLKIGERLLKRQFSQQVYISLALHIASTIKGSERKIDDTNNLDYIKESYPQEFLVAEIIFKYLKDELDFELPEIEKSFITMFMTMDIEKVGGNKNIGILFLAHGNSTANSIKEVVNTLLNTDHAYSLDMPLSKDVHEFYELVEEKVKEIDEGKGVLVIVDMGTLTTFGELIMTNTDSKVKILPFLTSLTALEATRKSLISDYTLEAVYDDMLPYIPQAWNGVAATDEKSEKNITIISTCLSGKGAALDMIAYVKKVFPYDNIKYLGVNKQDYRPELLKSHNVVAIIGAVDLELTEVPFISSEQLLLGNGLIALENILKEIIPLKNIENVKSHKNGLSKIIKESLNFLDAQILTDLLKESFDFLARTITIIEYNQILVTYMMHGGNMIERIILNQSFHYKEIEKKIKEHHQLYQVIKTALLPVEQKYNIVIPDTELGYLIDIFNTD